MGSVQQWTLVARCDVQRVLQQRIDTGSLTFLLQSVAATFFRFVLRMSVRGLGFLIGSLQSMQYSMMETIYVHVGSVLMFAMVLVWHDVCVREKGLTRITAPTTSSSHGIQNCVFTLSDTCDQNCINLATIAGQASSLCYVGIDLNYHCYWIWWCVQHCHSFATSFNWMHSFDEEQHWTFFTVSYSARNWIRGQCFIRDSRPASNGYGVFDYVTSMYAGILRTLRFFMILVLEYCTEKIQAFTHQLVYSALTMWNKYWDSAVWVEGFLCGNFYSVRATAGTFAVFSMSFVSMLALWSGQGSDTWFSEICRTFESSTSFECSMLFFEP